MNTMLAGLGGVLLGVWMCVFSDAVHAQEEDPLVAQTEQTEYAYGTVEQVRPNQLVVREYDFTLEDEVTVTYAIDPNATLTNVNALTEIAIGDDVDLDYVTRSETKVVTGIIVDKATFEDSTDETEETVPFGKGLGYDDEE